MNFRNRTSMLLKKLTSFALVAMMTTALAACNTTTPNEKTSTTPEASTQTPAEGAEKTPENASGDKIVIGGVGPLSGGASIYGEAAMNGAALYFEEVGTILGKPVEFIKQDDKHDPVESVNAFNKLVNDNKAVAIIGAVTSKPSSALAAESQKTGIPVITPTGTAADITENGPNVFRACFLDPYQGETMAKFAVNNLGKKTAAVLYDNGDDYSDGVAEAFIQAFEANGGTIVAKESFASADQDFKAQLTKIKEKSPDILFLPVYYNSVALIAAQAKGMDIQATMLGVDGWDGVLNVVSDPALVENSYFCNHYSPDDQSEIVQNFVKKYEEKYKVAPNAFAALGYDAAKLMTDAITKAGTTDKDAVVKALAEIDTDVVTSSGKLTFDANRNPIKGISIIKISGGKNVLETKFDAQQ